MTFKLFKRSIVLTFGLVLISFPYAKGQQEYSEVAIHKIEAVADSIAERAIETEATPSLTIAVGLNGTIIFSEGYGMADIEQRIPATPETVFGITSITKQFTAATILKLLEKGQISLDDSVDKFLPNFPLQGNHVTIRHLLNHTSGTPSMRSTSSIPDKNWFSKDLSYKEMINYFGNEPFEFEPGEKYAYNNFAYYLLGEIISRITGMPWDEYMEKEFFEPLNMDATGTCDISTMPEPGAITYFKGEEKFLIVPKMSKNVLGASGALCSTVEDLLRWNQALYNGEVISRESLQLMITPTVLTNGEKINEGFGLYLGDLGENFRISHGGTLPWGAFLSFYPESSLSIAVLTNSARIGREVAEEIEKTLARKILGVEVKNIDLAVKEMQRYKGTYVLRMGKNERELKIFEEQGNLMGQLEGQSANRLIYQGNHLFSLAVDPDIKIQFVLENGSAKSFVLQQGGRETSGVKKK